MIGFMLGVTMNYFIIHQTPELLNLLEGEGWQSHVAYYTSGGLVMGFLLYGFSKAIGEVFKSIGMLFSWIARKIQKRRTLRAWTHIQA